MTNPVRVRFKIVLSLTKTNTDPCSQTESSRVIHETLVYRQSHRTNDRMLINVASENIIV